MYNSQNLPLSPRKVTKKFIARNWALIILILIFLYFPITQLRPDNYGALLPFTFLILVFSVILFIGFIYEYLYYRLYYYNFQDDSAEIRKGVISRATGHVRYDRLQNIYVDQDVLDRIFGLYDVHYETAGEKSGFYSHVDGLRKENADKLVNFLKERAERKPINQASANPVTPVFQNQNTLISRSSCPLEPRVIISSTLGGSWIFLIVLFVAGVVWELRFVQNTLTPPVIGWGIAIAIFLSFIYTLVWYNNFNFSFSEERGEIKSSVIATSASFLAYDRIQNVNVHQGILDRLLGIYSVVIETAGETSGLKFVIYGLNRQNSEALKNFLLDRARAYKKL